MCVDAFGLVTAVERKDDAREAAIEIIEDTHGVTIEDAGGYTRQPSDWMIDGIWRECYLSTADTTKASEADLMCGLDPVWWTRGYAA